MKITEGKPWPQGRSPVAMALMKPVAGSPSANYYQADWYPTAIDPQTTKGWPFFKGDKRVPEVLGIPLLCKARLAGIVAVRQALLEELRLQNPGAVNGAATRSLGGKVWACAMPEGVEPAQGGSDGQNCEFVAARIGRGPLQFMPVLIVPETSKIIVPEVTEGDVRAFGPRNFVPRLPVPFESVPVL